MDIGSMSGCGGMADAQDSKSCGGDLVWVQVPPSAPDNDNLNPVSIGIVSDFWYILSANAKVAVS